MEYSRRKCWKVQAISVRNAPVNLRSVTSMLAASDYIAGVSSAVQKQHTDRDTASTNFEATFIFGGQIGTDRPETMLIYPQGNYIHESDEHPFLLTGEVKYGRPILDRVIKRTTPLSHAARYALVSMNSTVRSNLTVGPPIDLLIYEKGRLDFGQRITLTETTRSHCSFPKRGTRACSRLSTVWPASTGNTDSPLAEAGWESIKNRVNCQVAPTKTDSQDGSHGTDTDTRCTHP